MPSRAWVVTIGTTHLFMGELFQCPLGLELLQEIPLVVVRTDEVSMPSRAYTSFLPDYISDAISLGLKGFNALSGLYLISTGLHFWCDIPRLERFQCPLGLIPHFYRSKGGFVLSPISSVSMPSRAYTSFLRYPFKNLGFMRFPEPVFAGIYQNILTTAVFRAC